MIQNIKALGLAVVAVLAMSALAAAAAQAESFTAEKAPVTLSGGQTTQHVFEAGGGAVTCETAEFTGEATSTKQAEVEVAPEYDNCTAFGFINSSVDENGCKYRFSQTETISAEKDEYHGQVDLVCPTGQSITITAGPCTIHIPSQNNLETVKFTQNTADTPDTVTVTAAVTGITYTATSGFLCPLEEGEASDGKYSGSTKVSAVDSEGNKVGIGLTME